MFESYSDFANVYDELMDNVPYDDWFEYLHKLLTEYNINSGIIADLGCGTGAITERLAKAGYDMIGVDYSVSMLNIANDKKIENGLDILYLNQDMRELELFGTASAIVSICDSINYILEDEDLVEVFKRVNNYLDPNGLFIFDFNTRHYYKDIVNSSTIAEDREDISFIWDNYYDEDNDINELSLSLFIKASDDEPLYRKHEELHLQRGYTLYEIKELLNEAGLTLVAAYNAFTKEEATENNERIYIIASENGKNL